jgi:peptide-methionine (R)-S-oxide reductase
MISGDVAVTRREFIGMASVGAVALAVGARFAMAKTGSPEPAGNFPIHHDDAQWRGMLSPARYHVLREGGTEKPFSSALLSEHRRGVFACAGCGRKLFQSHTKFDSHTGWPSFWQALPGAVVEREDASLAMSRTEVLCAGCGGHLGHVFHDGPKPTGLRYCMNGLALTFQPGTA